MNFLDILIGIPVLFMGISGIKNGVISEILSVVALIAGIFISIEFSDLVCNWLNLNGKYANIIAFSITFLGVVVGVHILAKSLSFLAKKISLGFINASLGLVVGALKGFIFIGVLIYLWNLMDPNELILTETKRNASFAFRTVERYAEQFLPSIFSTLANLFNN